MSHQQIRRLVDFVLAMRDFPFRLSNFKFKQNTTGFPNEAFELGNLFLEGKGVHDGCIIRQDLDESI